jgi:hypothetical protein
MQKLLRLHRFCSLCVMRCMHRPHRSGGHLTLVRFSHDAQRQIQDQFEDSLRVSLSFTPQTLYEHFDLADLQASSAGQIAYRRHHCRTNPDYKEFLMQRDRASNEKKAGIKFRYTLLYQEIIKDTRESRGSQGERAKTCKSGNLWVSQLAGCIVVA